jgi:hypothetical protein
MSTGGASRMWPVAGATIILRLILGVIITLLPLEFRRELE